jgi:3-oxoacyl-[acyl-carrier protein] reductase
MDLKLRDKVALVTGGSRGLGRAICIALAAEGAKVAVNYQRNVGAAEEVVRQVARAGGRAVAIGADVADEGEVIATFDRTEQALGPVDVLVNSAGIWPTAYVKDMSVEHWDATMAVNLRGPFLTCREALRRWIPRGASSAAKRIVNVTSQAAFHGSTTGHADYAASKAGLVTFTVSLAREAARYGIYVNCVAPGMMDTEMTAGALRGGLEKYLARIPLGRIGTPEELADMVAFLASERASYTTGATFDVTGGMLMR